MPRALSEHFPACVRSVVRKAEQCYVIDPLLCLGMVVGRGEFKKNTLIGDIVVRSVEEGMKGQPPGSDGEPLTLSDVLGKLREIFAHTGNDDSLFHGRGVYSLKKTPCNIQLEGPKKKKLLSEFERECNRLRIGHCCPSLVQVVFSSMGRTHKLFAHPQDFIFSCKEMLINTPSKDIISLVEVPNSLQLTYKYYIDWDMYTCDIGFLPGELSEMDKLERVRNLALRTPELIAELFIEFGFVGAEDDIQVVIKEGSRWHKGKSCYKVGMHFIFQIYLTRGQFSMICERLRTFMGETSPSLLAICNGQRNEAGRITLEQVTEVPNKYLPLIGMDLHSHANLDQGLAMPFSRKERADPPSRLMRILHIKGGVEFMNEIPDSEIWTAALPPLAKARHVSTLNPSKVAWALMDASICVPGPRCIGIKTASPPSGPEDSERGVLGGSGGSTPKAKNAPFLPKSTLLVPESKGDIEGTLTHRIRLLKADLKGEGGGSGKKRPLTAHRVGHDDPSRKRTCRGIRCRKGIIMAKEDEDDIGELPEWFFNILQKYDPGFTDRVYTDFKYGSPPAGVKFEGWFFFQLNKSRACLCVDSCMKVPFEAYTSHASNGVLFCVSGEEVFASCMNQQCRERLKHNRNRYCVTAMRMQGLLDGEREGIHHTDEYFSGVLGRSGLEFLEEFEKDVVKQETAGTNGCEYDIFRLRKVPFTDMHNSWDENRTWIRLTEGLLVDYFESMR